MTVEELAAEGIRRIDVMDNRGQARRVAAILRREIRRGKTPYVDAWHGGLLANGWCAVWVTDREKRDG